ncbi:TSUP family transporter [Lactiplantibacillus mudanjiangensis]|uniref:Probable membrane transporter protein n=1 Tax=Lactiplantibacillus mudanjiangensis TaxID=1296538 RepID=A0A660DX60_9LACO|nr:TSUP family transporter [Lactiplantibacillus mudanjiangensis]VDG17818.1 permease [Lactobacillus sp.] [Lactiplantibacillus mudanjiangensis]VDG25479.1 permease [Lactobacillus sp.] [Lactiplantibacillus mudanjiangensis]VDG27933.1 permease [Lactobacillus sp.] [Lactiplantibacillus mudanjiangensis]VDG32484.1 permease [Lactobacillus sp.] [Lactiplantibacillus mudanjiangensis]
MVIIIVSLLTVSSLGLFWLLVRGAHRQQHHTTGREFGIGIVIGGITDFLDTLGIGSFVTTTAIFQASHYLKDERKLPGTLNTVHAIPTAVEALFFVTTVTVEPITLISLVLAAAAGAALGSEVMVKLNQRRIQWIMAVALVVTAILMAAKLLGWISLLGVANQATSLRGWPLVIGIVGNFILGLLMAAGVGLYAPCMVMVYFLGLTPLAAFPIMMLSCALLMPSSAINFIRRDRVDYRGLFGIIFGGIIGVILAATVVKSLSLTALSWLIVVVSLWTATSLARAASRKKGLTQ